MNRCQHVSVAEWRLLWYCAYRELGATSQPVSWRPLGSANLTLTKHFPLNGGSRVAMHLGTSGTGGGITNTGFWGIPVTRGGRYELSVYLRHPGSSQASMLAAAQQPCLHPLACTSGCSWKV